MMLREVSNVNRDLAVTQSHCAPAVRPPAPVASPPHMLENYADAIMRHLFERERSTLRDPTYLDRQPDIEVRMRVILIDWVVDVILKFKLRPETFFLAVDTIDRYLTVAQVSRGTLQLVAITSVLLAAKHEEIWAPEVRECVQITANTYTRDEVIRIEREIAAALRYRFTTPTPFPFMVRLLQLTHAPEEIVHLSHFFLELAALNYSMLQLLPSRVACCAYALARWTALHRLNAVRGDAPVTLSLRDSRDWQAMVWSPVVSAFASIADVHREIVPYVVEHLRFALEASSPTYRFHAVHRKYSSERFFAVARYELPSPATE